MQMTERIVLIALLLSFIGGGVAFFYAVEAEQAATRAAVARGEFERPVATSTPTPPLEAWRSIYPNTVPMRIGDVMVQASIADTLPERIKGLSDTPYLPDHVVKLFAFGSAGSHSIWMKDMNYSIDIIWADADGTIVHIEEAVAPETFPESFASPQPAWYVVETVAGFVASNTVAVGDEIKIPLPAQ